MREVFFRTFGILVVVAGCTLAGGCDKSSPPPVTVKMSLNVSDEQAEKLTKENLARIEPGMTLEEVSEILGPGMSVHDVKDDSVYEMGWVHEASKKAIWVKFRGHEVTGTSSSNIE